MRFEWLGTPLGIKCLDDWHNVKQNDLKRVHRTIEWNDMQHKLAETFPEHNWVQWKFHSTPKDYWGSLSNQKQCLNWLADKLGIKKQEDWYQIDIDNITDTNVQEMLKYCHNSLFVALQNS